MQMELRPVLAGYYPSWAQKRLPLSRVPFGKYTHLLFFSLCCRPDGSLDASHLHLGSLREFVRRCRKAGTVPLVCVGGWGRSSPFSPMAARAGSRARFVRELSAFLDRFDLLGTDIDWEYPEGRADRRNLTLLLRELKAAFRPRARRLSLAVPGTWSVIERASVAHCDAVHVMAYDLGEPHASFGKSERAIRFWRRFGVPREKLVLGVPFYGKRGKHGLPYGNLVRRHRPAPSDDEAGGYAFLGPATMERTARLAFRRGAGVMVWEVTQDAGGRRSLLDALHRAKKSAADSSG